MRILPGASLRESNAAENLPRVTFTVCVPPLFSTCDVNRIVEFVEMNRILGVRRLVFYLQQLPGLQPCPAVIDLLRFYQLQGLVQLHPWNITQGDPSGPIHTGRARKFERKPFDVACCAVWTLPFTHTGSICFASHCGSCG